MIYTLKNEFLTVKINGKGGELHAVTGAGGCEYLWNGDPQHWGERAPWLFPLCSHIYGDRYTYKGKIYHLKSRNKLHESEFVPTAQSENVLTLTFHSDAETKQSYPFDYTFSVTYLLLKNRIQTTVTVENNGNEMMPFSFGAHPGWRVPFDGKTAYEDFYLEFGTECSPDEIHLTDELFLNGQRTAFPLENGRRFPLSHNWFQIDGIFLARTANEITLKSDKDPHFVTIRFPDTPYLGFWSNPFAKAPLLCIEPWHGLPSFQGIADDLERKSDMYRLRPHTAKTFELTYIIG